MYKKIIRPLLFTLPPETAHAFTLNMLHFLPSFLFPKPQLSPVKTLGLTFDHPLGLAAGLDKNAEHLNALAKLGFSFIEVGTVTPKPQPGNPKPRLFRIPEACALINRMGFNNKGVDVLVENVKKANYQGILGVNIGKNKDTPLNHAINDYSHCLQKVYPYASYITVNISSPNTPDLRKLQTEEFLNDLLLQLKNQQLELAEVHKKYVPLLVKLSPDETEEDLKRIAESILTYRFDGIIATNTTNNHESIKNLPHGNEPGGLSGVPLATQSTACLKLLKQVVGNEVTLVGVGGVHNKETVKSKLEAGADLLQVYTGLIYEGHVGWSQRPNKRC
ncbi:dihydroorotate oxidase [Legionella adelaidensis]|uniref:Dihydroorotate dehydrogenase (quinone) n=1 Tax=Legionella adelaidensis TaxID=45056 RepID=A0A0W0R3D4_9GAMM|nr:quinone-dependent dihydroorotate dehydrogenase [Legionella adelaidensis]KTC65581.1 dihydroorotate oxidase [Legionella adelaidensis]